MRGMKSLVLIMMLLAVAAGCQAAVKGSADVVSVAAGAPEITGTAGQRVDLAVKLDIARSWHIYAHADTNFIGVDLVPDEDFPLQELQVVYPQGHQKEFFGDKVFMIEGKDIIKASALVPAGMKPGKYPLQFKVTAQACDDKTCLAPAYIPVAFTLEVK